MKIVYSNRITINLSFFDAGEKTEQPTAKKRTDARAKGQVASSQELGTAFLFLSAFFGLKLFSGGMLIKLLNIFRSNFNYISDIENLYSVGYISRYITFLFGQLLLIIAPLVLLSMFAGVASNLMQVGWKPTLKPMKVNFGKLNPLSGIKRLFSLKILIDLVKALAKFAVVGIVIYNNIKKEINHISELVSMSLLQAVTYIGNIVVNIGLNVGVLFLFIALADIFYTRFKHTKDLRMTKQEVKDEYKNSEGDPHIKGKIKQKMREMSMRRMMQDVPSADVIITNPTHYSVAVKYDKDSADAPIVVAKGVDFLAKRIREKAKESNIQIVENKQLARALYASVDVGQNIPPELYQSVAEVLAFVYNLKNE
jgi:flagellar biosynthesis protein FlhB